MTKSNVTPERKSKPPAHEVILITIEQTLKNRGHWPEIKARALVKVLGEMHIPPTALPEVIRRLQAIGKSTLRNIRHGEVLTKLEQDRLESIR
jgi:hypothetical protein